MTDQKRKAAPYVVITRSEKTSLEVSSKFLEHQLIDAGWLPRPMTIEESSSDLDRDIWKETNKLNSMVAEAIMNQTVEVIPDCVILSNENGETSRWKIKRIEYVKFLRKTLGLTAARVHATNALYETAILGLCSNQ